MKADPGRGQEILIAEDNPTLAAMLKDYLGTLSVTARTTGSAQEAKRWLQEAVGPLVLDGSVFAQMGIPLGELPPRAIIWSGDYGLVEEARQLGLRAFCKGNVQDFEGLLANLAAINSRVPATG